MWFHSVLALWSPPPARKRRPEWSPHQRPGFRPRLEVLEDRCVPSTLNVTDNADNGAVHTLRWAVGQAKAGDTIDILTNQPITLTQGELYLAKNLSIEAPAGTPATISGNHHSRVFEVAAGSVTLDNLVITGGNGVSVNPSNSGGWDTLGGGILNEGQLTITNSSLLGNFAAYDGGGIANTSSGSLTINSCTLSGNSATNGGGGIVNWGGAMTVDHCILSGNSATYGGGIVNGYNGSGPMATVSNSTLAGNSASYGGGIFSSQNLAINNSTLSNNTAVRDGGGTYNEGSCQVTGTILSNNFAGSSGGGIFNGSSLSMNSTTVSSNTAIYGGGVSNGGVLTVSNSTLSRNSATDGGGIWTNGFTNFLRRTHHLASATISNCSLSGNSATSGGAIYNGCVWSTVHVGGSTFSGNTPDNIFGAYIDDGGNKGL